MPDDENATSEKPYVPRKHRRQTRYEKAVERRRASKAKDQRFYNMMFSVAGLMIAVVFGIAFLLMNSGGIDVSGMETLTAPWVLGFSKLELAGLALVALFGVYMWIRIARR